MLPIPIAIEYAHAKGVSASEHPRTLRFYAYTEGAEALNAKVRVVIAVIGEGSSMVSRECAMTPVLQWGSIDTVGASETLATAFALAQQSHTLEQSGDLLQMDIDIRIIDMAYGEPDSGYDDMVQEGVSRSAGALF